MGWKRPENLPVPQIWREFEGKSGRKYWVQDITDEYKKIVVNFMCFGFNKEEPMCKYSNASTYKQGIEEFKAIGKVVVDQNVGLLCLTKDEKGYVQIAGMNCTIVFTVDDDKDEDLKAIQFERTKKIFDAYAHVSKAVDPFKKFNITKYLSAMGLYVLPEFRREGIGTQMLKAREALCKALDIKVSCSSFSSILSQIVAAKAGYKDLYSIAYKDLPKKAHPSVHFPGIEEHTEFLKFMYIEYDH